MRISLNILLEAISGYNHDIGEKVSGGLSFQAISLLPCDLRAISADNLYVCRLSEAIRAAEHGMQLNCLCIRDRIKDSTETPETLRGMVIINENLELGELFCKVQSTFTLISNWYENMQYALIMQKSMQDILDISAPIIGNFISISDSALALLAYTKNITTDDPVSLYLIENGYHSEDTVKKFKKLKRYDTWANSEEPIVNTSGDIAKYTVVNKVFSFDNMSYYMHVVMSCNHRPLTDGLLDIFGYLIRILDHYVKKDWEEERNYNSIYSSFFKDLMSGTQTGMERAGERARIVGINPDAEYIIMILTGGTRGDTAFPGHLSTEISQMFSFIKPVYYNFRLVLFLHATNLDRLIDEHGVWDKLNAYFKENNVSSGASDIFGDIQNLPDAYQQAEAALNESLTRRDMQASNGFFHNQDENTLFDEPSRDSCIAHINAYYANCLLDTSGHALRIWKSSRYGKLLLQLRKNDLDKQTNNLELLFAYLLHERRASETAAAFHMHRNNVVYRISRIEESFGLNLNDTQTRMNIMMSFLMLKRFGF